MARKKKLKVRSQKSHLRKSHLRAKASATARFGGQAKVKVKSKKPGKLSGRKAFVERNTKETQISIFVDIDGSGKSDISTGIGFFDHMLELFAKRALIDLEVQAKGDLHIDLHHTVEDIGIVLGQVIKQALGNKKGIVRYASINLPMDEALAEAAIDISGRPYLHYDQPVLADTRVGEFDTYLLKEFFDGFVNNAGLTLHVKQLAGNNTHHVLEAFFKAFGQVFGQACRLDPKQKGIPSTKGVL